MKKRAPLLIALLGIGAILYYALSTSSRPGENGLSGSGTIEATEVDAGSPLAGIVQEIRFSEGDAIKAGETIGVIRHNDLAAQLRALESALQAAGAQIRQGEIKLQNARRNLERLSELARAGSVPQQRYDDADAAMREASAGLEAARHQRDNLVHQREALAERIDYAVVTSPLDGIMIGKYFEVGELAPAGAVLATLADLSEVWLKLYLPERELGLVRIGQQAEVTIDSHPGRVFAGKVTWISPVAEFTPKNIQTREERVKLVYAVKITVPNPEMILKIGMPADARILADQAHG